MFGSRKNDSGAAASTEPLSAARPRPAAGRQLAQWAVFRLFGSGLLRTYAKAAAWLLLAALFFTWVGIAGYHHWQPACLLTALAAGCFTLGSLLGFIFSSYDEESSTIGKLKDWLVGALATITLVKFAALKPVLLAFTLHGTAAEFAVALSVAVASLGAGFYFMFFGRELFFNVPLARRRNERNRIEAGQAGEVAGQLLAALPSSLLLGIDDIAEMQAAQPAEYERLRTLLYSADVQKFLDQSAGQENLLLGWDVVSRNAYLHYYRTYFEPELGKQSAAAVALRWIDRALAVNPNHVDFTTKRADMLGSLRRFREVVDTLERLLPKEECPVFVHQWLGYYLLFVPGRQQEAIVHSNKFLHCFGPSTQTQRNLACAWAQLACREAGSGACTVNTSTEAYAEAIRHLEIVVNAPGKDRDKNLEHFRTVWIGSDQQGHFRCFQNDAQFRALVGLPPA